ncbi:glycosyltransferase family 2 protein [Phormidium sp. FACHB-1136]|uniref:glycosyltransferase family 2 protein n=1 Tax=Phormidium sp. FACHB-1136 TaxID=2692848 RepID=UPI0016890C83|nr:glycosyltransferase family 2 protein [Phormidium sp. FACHB-1136]MBD2424583.1 glycosyltransferase family 2 protein [Phormidium sp. FACHB-1136]
MPIKITISIVTYHPEIDLLKKVLSAIIFSSNESRKFGRLSNLEIFLVDNGNDFHSGVKPHFFVNEQINEKMNIKFLTGHGNVGYGLGNNLAFEKSTGDYFLVLNPDVLLEKDALTSALSFMEANPDCGLLSPSAIDSSRQKLYLCKRYPSIFDLLIRGFLPRRFRQLFSSRLAKYEMRDILDKEEVFWNPELVSGCFMLFRRDVFESLQGFNPKYFMYFEDFDISIRTRKISPIAYVPSVKIEHYGGYASRKGLKHISMFLRSAITFFNSHGWKVL